MATIINLHQLSPLDWLSTLHCKHRHVSAVQKLRQRLEQLRAVAARTPPQDRSAKKRAPQELWDALAAATRPFYLDCEAAPNVNKAKQAATGLLVPMLAPWAALNTIKARLQTANAKVTNPYALEMEKFRDLASVTSAISEYVVPFTALWCCSLLQHRERLCVE